MRDPGDFELQGPLLKNGIVALAGGGQTGAPVLTSPINRLGTVATGGDSVQLPLYTAVQVGEQIMVINGTATSANVFPGLGDQINNTGANTALAVPANKSAIFVLTAANLWNSILSA